MPKPTTSPMIKDKDQYNALRNDGMSKEKAARIATASARDGRSAVATRGGNAEDYDERTKAELLGRAREIGINGRSSMNKSREVVEKSIHIRSTSFNQSGRLVHGRPQLDWVRRTAGLLHSFACHLRTVALAG